MSVQTFPIGIEPSEFHYRLEKSSVQETLRKMRADLSDTKVILGVDRLDCIKGIPQKLHAFDRLLERYPNLIGEAVLLQVAIPSRDDLKSHQDLKEEIQHLVGEINGKYGTFCPFLICFPLFLILAPLSPLPLLTCVRQTLTITQAKSTTSPSNSSIPPSTPTSSPPYTPPQTSASSPARATA